MPSRDCVNDMKIKWVKNSRVNRNSKIDSSDILEKESDAHGDDIIVIMKNVTKEHPIINIKLPRKPVPKENKVHTNGKWVTRSWTDYSNVIVSVNTEEDKVRFSHNELRKSELNDIIQILNQAQ